MAEAGVLGYGANSAIMKSNFFIGLFAASLCGFLVALSFPTILFGRLFPDLGFLAWVALIPLLLITRRLSLGGTFLLAFIAGFIANATTRYWVFIAVHSYGKFSLGWSIVVVLLSYGVLAVLFSLPFVVANVVLRWSPPFRVGIFAVAWVAAEYLKNVFPFGGLPWANLAYTQSHFLPILQIADLTGVYGIVFLITLVNAVIAELILQRDVRRLLPLCAVTSILVAIVLGYGWYQLTTDGSAKGDNVNIALIHGSRPIGTRLRRETMKESQRRSIELSQEAVVKGADVVIWPEASFYRALGFDEQGIMRKIGALGVPLIVGSTSVEGDRRRNSALFYDRQGNLTATYQKMHLVPLGEYLPWPINMSSLVPLNPGGHRYVAGREIVPFPVSPALRLGMMICYEDLFPEIARANVLAGANALGVILSDGWFT